MYATAYTRVASNKEDSFSVEELSQLTGLSKSLIADRCRWDVLPAEKYKTSRGVMWFIEKQDALQWLEKYYPQCMSNVVESNLINNSTEERINR